MFKISEKIKKLNESFNQNKINFIIEKSINILLFIFFFSLPTISYTSLSSVSILLMGIVGVLIFIWNIINGDFFIDYLGISMISYILCVCISAVCNDISLLTKTYFILPMMFLVFYHYFRNEKFLKHAIVAYIFGVSFFAIFYLLFYIKDIIAFNFSRLGSDFSDENIIGMYFTTALAMIVYHILFRKKYYLCLFAILIIFLGFTTGSKAFLLSAAVAIIYILINFFGRKKWYITFSIMIGMLFLFFIMIQLPIFSYFKVRIMDLLKFISSGDMNSDQSTSARIIVLFESIEIFLNSPIIGNGVKGVQLNSSLGMCAHNTIFENLANFGLIGLISFMIPIFSCFKIFKNKDRGLGIIMKCILILLLIECITALQFQSKLYYILLAMIAGYAHQIKNTKALIKIEFKFKKATN